MRFVHVSPLYEMSAPLTLAALAGFIGQLPRQPMIVNFIAIGVLAAPRRRALRERMNIKLLAELGIAVLLFLAEIEKWFQAMAAKPRTRTETPIIT